MVLPDRRALIAFFLSCSVIFLATAQSDHGGPTAERGVIDLTSWDFFQDGTVTLDGEWAFYWKELLGPEAFVEDDAAAAEAGRYSDGGAPGDARYVPVPRVWNGLEIDGTELGGHGYGTYRLVILVRPDTEYAVKFLDAASAFRVWIDGAPVFESGTVGTDRASMVPEFRTGTADVYSPDGHIELIVHVSNFVHPTGGLWLPYEFGPEQLINEARVRNLLIEFVLFGSISIIGFYHLGLFVLRRKERSALYFGLFCVLIALRIVVTGERMLHNYAPWMGWGVLTSLAYLTFYLGAPLFVAFLQSLFPEVSRRVTNIVLGVGAVFSAVVLFTPPSIFSHTLPYYQTVTLAFGIYTVYAVVRAVAHHRQGSLMVTIGSVLLLATLTHDIMLANGWIQGISIAPIGTVLFVFIQAIMLSIRFANAFQLAEELSTELEKKVEERTERLRRANLQLRNTQSQLLQSQKMEAMGTLAGGIAHEFNNILGAQLGYTEILLDRISPESREGEYLQAMYRSGQRAAALVRQILTFSRGDGEELKPQHVQDHIRETLSMVRTTLPRSIELVESIDPDCGPILANETQISQVVVNLCTNGVHAMKGRPGRLEVSLQEEVSGGKPMVVLRVRDTGKGIPAEIRERIFDPFFTTKEVGEGSGLGLSIVHGIVSSHHGTIDVTSTPGEGTEFTIRFPETDEAVKETATSEEHLQSGSAHIMIVEDDQELAAFYEATLRELGYTTTLVYDGSDALHLFREDPQTYDLVFTDQIMSGMSGFDMSREILRLRPEIPIILSSGYTTTVTPQDTAEAGIRHFLPKPVKIAELTGKIWELVQR